MLPLLVLHPTAICHQSKHKEQMFKHNMSLSFSPFKKESEVFHDTMIEEKKTSVNPTPWAHLSSTYH
jgi:hypothetical protein